MLLFIFTAPEWISLVTLIMMEIVLGIDNIIFIAILCTYIPKKQEQKRARLIGLSLALVFRIALLATISWIVRMVQPLFFISSFGVSGKSLILFGGGIFLIYKTVQEIYEKLRGHEKGSHVKKQVLTVTQAILQITFIDIVFSFDSILTAVGLSRELPIMITAVIASMFVMLFFAPYVTDFINKYPTLKMLALTLLIMGAHGHQAWKDMIFGTTVNTVRHRVNIPVLIVR